LKEDKRRTPQNCQEGHEDKPAIGIARPGAMLLLARRLARSHGADWNNLHFAAFEGHILKPNGRGWQSILTFIKF
jgi:hypothetical protein